MVPEQQWSILGRQPKGWEGDTRVSARESPRVTLGPPRHGQELLGHPWELALAGGFLETLQMQASEHLTPCGGIGRRFLPLFQRQKQPPPHTGLCPSTPPLHESYRWLPKVRGVMTEIPAASPTQGGCERPETATLLIHFFITRKGSNSYYFAC